MSNFIGVKLVDAEPITLGAYNVLRGWGLPTDGNCDEPGYFIKVQMTTLPGVLRRLLKETTCPLLKGIRLLRKMWML